MRKRGARAIALFILLALAGCSDASDESRSVPDVDPLVFEITNANGDVEGWLLGTIHALPDGTQWRTPAIEGTISKADLLLVEVARLDDRNAIARTFAALATTPGQPPLHSKVTEDRRALLDTVLIEADRTAESFGSTETWAAALILSRVGSTGNARNGIDTVLLGDFSNREVREFEGVRGQLGIFDRLPEEDQRDLLEGVLDEIAMTRNDPDRLRQAWLSGDEAELETATKRGIMSDPELYRILLVDRNASWTLKLEDVLRGKERPLVAVGAGHLVGRDSIAAMLEQRGYTVTRLHR